MPPTITIGFVPRERFALAAQALERVLDYTDLDYQLVVVDSATPPRYWREIERLLIGRKNVEIIRSESNLLPNESKNLVADVADGELTCLVENDLLVAEGWLSKLVTPFTSQNADAVAPRVMEGWQMDAHVDRNTGHFSFVPSSSGPRLEIAPLDGADEIEWIGPPAQIEVAETHCLLLRTTLLRTASPFDGRLNTREFIDTGLSLRHAGARYLYEPRCQVTFIPPPRVLRDERDFYLHKWNYATAVASHSLICEKWGLAEIPNSLRFIRERSSQVTRTGWFMYRLRTRWRSGPRWALRNLANLARGA